MFVLLCHCQESPNVGHLHRWLDEAEGQIEIDVQQRCASRVWRKHEGLPKSGVLFVDWNRAFFGIRFHLLYDWPNMVSCQIKNIVIICCNHSTSQFWSWLLVAVARCSTFVVGRVLQFQWRARETHHIRCGQICSCQPLLLFCSFAFLQILFLQVMFFHFSIFQLLGSCGFLSHLPWSGLRSVCSGEVCIKDRYIMIYIYDMIWLFLWIIAYYKTTKRKGTLNFTNMNLSFVVISLLIACLSIAGHTTQG